MNSFSRLYDLLVSVCANTLIASWIPFFLTGYLLATDRQRRVLTINFNIGEGTEEEVGSWRGICMFGSLDIKMVFNCLCHLVIWFALKTLRLYQSDDIPGIRCYSLESESRFAALLALQNYANQSSPVCVILSSFV